MCGESASFDDNVCKNWKEELKTMLKDYDPKNIFNADETALYYQCLPDKTLTFKNEKCHGGKNSKVRATLLLASNMTGTEKLKPFMIGKYKKPRCFAGVKSFPFEYHANPKAWMNSYLFGQWLLKLDKQMKRRKNVKFFYSLTTVVPIMTSQSLTQSKFSSFLPTQRQNFNRWTRE